MASIVPLTSLTHYQNVGRATGADIVAVGGDDEEKDTSDGTESDSDGERPLIVLSGRRRRRQPGVFAPQRRASSDSESPASASASSSSDVSASSDDEDETEDDEEDEGSYDSSGSSSSDPGRPRLRWQPPPPPPAWAARARKVQPHGSPDGVPAASAVVPVSRLPLAQRLEGSAITVLSTRPALADEEDEDEEDEVYDTKPFVRGRDRWIHRGRPVGQGDATS